MPKSFRIDPDLERRLEEVARCEAIARQCEGVLGKDLSARLADVIGVVESGGGRARRSGRAFKDALAPRARR